MTSISRRSFLAGSAATAVLAGLAGCDLGGQSTSKTPKADAYPIEPDGKDVKAKWTSEEVRDGWTRYVNEDGAELGTMDTSRIIQVDGYAFRDLNGNGKLDFYEDWRQSAEDRAKSLADSMEAEDILPLMFHDGMMSASAPLDDDSVKKLQEGLRAGVSRANANADTYAGAIAWINAVQEWCEKNDKFGIPYMNSTDPYQLYSIPDNHCLVSSFDPDLWKKSGHFTGRAWRATGARVNLGPQVDVGSNIIYTRMGGSICEDPATNRDVARAFGGGMQSTWGDAECKDDKGWGKDSVAVMFKHYVGGGAVEGGRNDHNDAGKYDVFPGDNFEAHLIPFLDGGLKLDSKTEKMAAVMPNYGIAYDKDEKYGPLWGGAYNKRNLSILRNAGWDGMVTTDWQILRETDFGDRAHGVKDMTEAERFEMLLEATVDQVGGDWAVDVATEGYKLYAKDHGEDEALKRLRDSARRIFTVMNQVQLFDNPYCDRSYAKQVLEDQDALDFGQTASDKSIVMLKNAGNVISKDGIKNKPKAYIPTKQTGGGGFFGPQQPIETKLALDEDDAKELFDVVTDSVDAEKNVKSLAPSEMQDCAYVFYTIGSPDTGAGEPNHGFGPNAKPADPNEPKYLPISLQYRPYTAEDARDPSIAGDKLADGSQENRSYKGKSVTASNEEDLNRLIEIRKALPDAKIILAVEASNNAQCFHEIEEFADVILWSWSAGGRDFSKAYCRILSGEVEPSGLLPCQMPLNMETVEKSLEDVPRDVECYTDSEGNTYDFCFGLNWSGVIDDERVKKYKVDPLTKPEAKVQADE